jgi:hypothetical protein
MWNELLHLHTRGYEVKEENFFDIPPEKDPALVPYMMPGTHTLLEIN